MWSKLIQQPWFQELLKNREYYRYIHHSKEHGLLNDPYYIEKLLTHEGTREGFINYLKKQLN